MTQIEEACQELYRQQATEFLPILTALTPLLLQVSNEVIHDERGYGLKLSGFYKDGSVTVRPGENDGSNCTPSAVVDGRYEQLEQFYQGEDLLSGIVRLNASRFRYWNDVKPEFSQPDSCWLPLLIEHGLVEPVVQTTYRVR